MSADVPVEIIMTAAGLVIQFYVAKHRWRLIIVIGNMLNGETPSDVTLEKLCKVSVHRVKKQTVEKLAAFRNSIQPKRGFILQVSGVVYTAVKFVIFLLTLELIIVTVK